jgi:hypothetical protein
MVLRVAPLKSCSGDESAFLYLVVPENNSQKAILIDNIENTGTLMEIFFFENFDEHETKFV